MSIACLQREIISVIDQKRLEIPDQFIEEPNVTAAVWEQMTDTARLFDQNSDKISIQDIGAGYAINVRHEPASNGSPRVQMGGSLPDQLCYTVSQIINFRAPFDFGGASVGTQVGKSGFGLAGGGSSQAATLGNIVAGGDPSTSGYSIRPAWTAFDTVSGQPEFMFYSYHANRNPVSGTFGENIQTGHVIVPGQDIDVELEICMNDPGSSNGTIRAWINGGQVVNRSDILWMDGTPEIDWCFFCSFHGGGGDSAPGSDQSISYRNIVYS